MLSCPAALNQKTTSRKKYDVFISFRGEDTRFGITSHLYDALIHKSINTYIDYQLNRGEDVWPALEKAIEASYVSIVVFSENYATSKWCLEELVKVLQCRKLHGQVVIPVFYKTDPSHIRKQTGSYGNAFAKHERDLGTKDSESNKLKVQKWKEALTEAANISGWDTQTHKDESILILKIVNDVLQKLQLMHPNELEGVVRNEKNCESVESLLKSFRRLGIWGMGGIGKSTIAKVLFAKHFAQYDHVCFANAKQYSVSKLFSELLKDEISPSDVVISEFHMRRLRSRKVLIVIDNVESSDQFEYLCRDYHDLTQDSRLIITTRDRQLLNGRVDWVYNVRQWEDPKSLDLFCLEAFVPSHPRAKYEHLLQRAITYAGGVPLALKLLALHLRTRDIAFWESSFKKLDDHPDDKLNKVLKVSYDELDALQKKIFLDIAFFFIGEKKECVTTILDACGFEPNSGIVVLKDKSLITISNNHTIQMHDLLQKLGSDIIRNDCGEDLAAHTRLSGSKAREVIEENKGSSSIEGITLDLSQNNDIPLSADTFTKMKGLRILKFHAPSNLQRCTNTYLNLPKFLKPFSNKLRYFEWYGYPFESLPQPFYAKFLVEIRMPHSNVKQLWQGRKELGNLEGIDLSECKDLIKLPDFFKASSLKRVNLSGCESLVDLHPSVLFANTLVTLILDRCKKVRRVRGEIHLNFLEKISVDACTSLEEFAVSSNLIENLDLSSTGIQTLDLSIGSLEKLKRLNLDSLRLNCLPKGLSSVTSIIELKISGRALIAEKQQIHKLFDGLRSLQILHMKDFINRFELPNNIHVVSKLKELNLDGSNMKRLPQSIKKLGELEILSLVNCRKLESIPELPPRITVLNAVNCTSLVSVSNQKELATKMMGKTKHISFSNSLNLDRHSLRLIMESLNSTMMSAVFQNVSVRTFRADVHSYNYNSVDACGPGTSIPRLLDCETVADSSITIQLIPHSYNLLGFIYAVVVSPAGGNGMESGVARIKCQCKLGEDIKASWLNTDVSKLNSDHVYVWYDPFHCDSILKFYQSKICFEFYVTNVTGEVNGSIGIKECGVRQVSVEELESILPELELDSEKEEELKAAVEFESEHIITLKPIEKHSVIISLDSGDTQVHENLDDDHKFKEIMKSKILRKSISLKKVDSTEGGYDVEGSINKETKFNSTGNEGRSTESEAAMHLPLVLTVEGNDSDNKSSENNHGWQDNFDETKNQEEKPNIQGGQITVPDTNDLISEPEQEKENAPIIDFSKNEDGSDDDLFAELDSILLGSPESSPKSTCSTSDVAVRKALHDLECLLENSLESILSDVELQRQLHMSLECIKQESHENVSPNVVKLVQKMTSSIENLFKDFVMAKNVVEDHNNAMQQKEKLMKRVRDAKKQKESLKKENSQFEDEAKHLEEEGEKVDEKIRILVVQKKSIELEKTRLKESMERCQGEKKKVDSETKNLITESKELMASIKKLKPSYTAALSKQQKLKDKWEGFRVDFADNYGSSSS